MLLSCMRRVLVSVAGCCRVFFWIFIIADCTDVCFVDLWLRSLVDIRAASLDHR